MFDSLEPRRLFSGNKFVETDLVSNQPGAAHQDADLINGWGIDIRDDGTLWVSAADAHKSTIYDDQGNTVLSAVNVDGTPTGVLYNDTTSFVVKKGSSSAPADVLFVTEEGKIEGWADALDPANTITEVVSSNGSSYKGLALNQQSGAKARLFAANFGKGRIDVFNGKFQSVRSTGKFTDSKLPTGYSPFNVSMIGSDVYVSYAQKQAHSHDEVDGAGLGIVDVYTQSGTLVKRLATGGKLNAPWAMVQAPKGFGPFAGDILVGNFGDGKINIFNPTTAKRVDTLKDSSGHAIDIDGLWGMTFGKAKTSDADKLFFAAGPDNEANGLVGVLAADPPSSPSLNGIDY